MNHPEPIQVLDHGFARLVSYMQPNLPTLLGEPLLDASWTGDLEILRNARVSYNADWRTGEDAGKDERLIRYLQTNHHTSPLEAMVFTFEVQAPLFVLRQWHRHRTWSYNEVSARYTTLPEVFYIPKPEHVGTQSTTNKQMRVMATPEAVAAGLDQGAVNFIEDLQLHSEFGFELYKKHLAEGVPRELARLFLGLNTYSRMFCTVDLHNLLHFLRLRMHEHSQYEIRVYAQALAKLVQPVVPFSIQTFKELHP